MTCACDGTRIIRSPRSAALLGVTGCFTSSGSRSITNTAGFARLQLGQIKAGGLGAAQPGAGHRVHDGAITQRPGMVVRGARGPWPPTAGGYGGAMTLVAQHVSLDAVQVSSIKSVY
jgi:hypothetical protein